MSYKTGFECPHCDKDLEDDINTNNRWNHNMACPYCNEEVHVDFDFIVGDDHEEWDLFEIKKIEDT